ncbi:ATP-binding protein [Streptomyces sp. NPDC049813]|uniref:ATP-binding protein n=1 Tax=Streptomyces sp. NPDC049813 TaxID=3365597 RepID=UPI0037BCE1CE
MALALDGSDSCIGQARRAATQFLSRAAQERHVGVSPRAVQDTELIVSELVTNVVKYAPGPGLLQLRLTADTVLVEVWDSDPLLPAVRAADPSRIGQHGLEIVTFLARSMTFQPTVVGKRVRVGISLSPAETAS